jgi:integrase
MGEKTYFDRELPGFGLRCRASGAKSWLVQYAVGGRTRKISLGTPSTVHASEARKKARELLAKVRLCSDPAFERTIARVQAAETVGALLPRYLERQRLRLRPGSLRQVKLGLLNYAKPLHGYPIATVTRRVIAARIAEVTQQSGPRAANGMRATLSAFFMWAAKEGLVESNVVGLTNKPVVNGPRTRVLADNELRQIWLALGDDRFGAIVQLLILTGARRVEIGGLRWSEVDLDAALITLPGARTKNNHEHVIPLSPLALSILTTQKRLADRDLIFARNANGFTDWAYARKSLNQQLPDMPRWVLHDFRRSLSTSLHERFGILPHVVEAILGHVGGHQGGVAGTYNRAVYLDERRRALQRWSDHIEALVSGQPVEAQVVQLRR